MLKSIAVQLPAAELRDLALELLTRGLPLADVVDELVAFADALIDWRKIIKGPAGAAAEASDGPLLRLVIKAIVAGVRAERSPQKRA